MTEFKVGDRVRRIKDPANWAPLGFESQLVHLNGGLGCKDKSGAVTGMMPEQWELVPSGPVRTVMRREIRDGQYGQVSIFKAERPEFVAIAILKEGETVNIDTPHFFMDAIALRSLCMVASQIAEALEDRK